jgi:hypothetical protein
MRLLVHSVDTVIAVIGGNGRPRIVLVIATGRVSSSGWSDPQLEPRIYIVPPSDGILEFDFTAERSDDDRKVLPYVVPVAASILLPVPDWVDGVRVKSFSNSEQSTLSSANNLPNPAPQPWFASP